MFKKLKMQKYDHDRNFENNNKNFMFYVNEIKCYI